MAKHINIGIIGAGNIGSALIEVIRKNHAQILETSGIDIRIAKVCDVQKKQLGIPFTCDYREIANDPSIDLVVEAIGNEQPALKIVLAAIKNKKHVVTPNKEMLAKHMGLILNEANRAGVQVLFEASVCGGIPIITAMQNSLVGDRIDEVYGIVNGTTNYILTQMTKHGSKFSEALLRAKEKGYAEPKPEADIKGYDAKYKAAILASVAFNAQVDLKNIYCEGIDKISPIDIEYAAQIGYAIKLLAIAKREQDKLDIRVHPALVPFGHPLAGVSNNYNAVYVIGFPVGDLMFYGQGAGGEPTASALIGDILAIANGKNKKQTTCLPAGKANNKKYYYKKIEDIESRYYIRLETQDKHGVLAGISRAFASKKVGISAVMQQEVKGKLATIVILLHQTKEKNMRKALQQIEKLGVVKKISNIIRII